MSPLVERMTTLPALAAAIVLGLGLAATGDAGARSSDRNQPMDLQSNHSSCGVDDTGACTFTGNVEISQGTLRISAAQATLYRVDGDVSRAVLTGSPVILRQEMDDGTPMTARASNIDYNLRTEIVVFTGDVRIEQPRGSMSGARVVYNLQTGNVESGGEGAGRVRMRILPKGARGEASDAAGEGG